jgi:hypothetical protein
MALFDKIRIISGLNSWMESRMAKEQEEQIQRGMEQSGQNAEQ